MISLVIAVGSFWVAHRWVMAAVSTAAIAAVMATVYSYDASCGKLLGGLQLFLFDPSAAAIPPCVSELRL